MRTIYESDSTPKADGFFMPAEFAPQDRVWMGWPHRTDTWAHGAKPAQKQYAAIARAIAEFTPVTMCANQADYADRLCVNDAWRDEVDAFADACGGEVTHVGLTGGRTLAPCRRVRGVLRLRSPALSACPYQVVHRRRFP